MVNKTIDFKVATNNRVPGRLKALKEIASHFGYGEAELFILGNILSLKDHPEIRVFDNTHDYKGARNFCDYEAKLKKRMSNERILKMLSEHGLPQPQCRDRIDDGLICSYKPREFGPQIILRVRYEPYQR